MICCREVAHVLAFTSSEQFVGPPSSPFFFVLPTDDAHPVAEGCRNDEWGDGDFGWGLVLGGSADVPLGG